MEIVKKSLLQTSREVDHNIPAANHVERVPRWERKQIMRLKRYEPLDLF